MKYLSLRLPAVLSLAAVFFLAPTFASAQKDKDWRPIDPADLASTKPTVDADADAEAIFWEVRIDDSSTDDLSMKHYVRVKIFTERGREKYSKFDIPFKQGLKIKDLAARVTKPDGSVVDIKKEDVFEREIVKANGIKIKAKSFAVPNIEPGVIVEYRYKEVYEGEGARGRRLEFQLDIPVRSLAYYYKPFEGDPSYKIFNSTDTKFVKDKNGFYLASRTNVPAFKQEPNMPPDDMVRPWMRLGWSGSFSGWFGKAAVYGFLKTGGGDMKKLAAQLTEGAATDEEKLQRLYDYCQTQISNTTYDTSLTDEMRDKLPKVESIKDVIKRKQAGAGFITALFGALAISAGYDARPAYIGDRSEMLTTARDIDDDFLSLAAIGVQVGGRWRYYAPGIKFLAPGQLPWMQEDSAAELIGEKQYQWVQTPYSDYKTSVTRRTGQFQLHEDGSLEGTVTLELNGQPALGYRLENYDETPDKRSDMLIQDVKRQISTAEVSNVSIEGVNEPSKPLVMKYTVKVPNYAQKTGKRLFLQPGYFEYGNNPVFSTAERKYDIFFRYPWSEEDKIDITYPKNFDLDNADAPSDVGDPKNIGSDVVVIGVDRPAGQLHYERKFHFGGNGAVLFSSGMYTPLKGMFDAFHKVDTHTLTLKQK
jgi:Domain of Unknown Function with PDB structure (DUF3857)